MNKHGVNGRGANGHQLDFEDASLLSRGHARAAQDAREEGGRDASAGASLILREVGESTARDARGCDEYDPWLAGYRAGLVEIAAGCAA